MNRGRRAVLASALLLLAILGGAALVFRDGIRERWLIWKLEHGDREQAREASKALGAMGSLGAIEPLARRLGVPPSRTEQAFVGTRSLTCDVLSAIHAIAQIRREECLPYLAAATRGDLSKTWKDALRRIAQVASREGDTVDLSLPEDVFSHDTYFRIQPSPPPGSDPPLRTPRAGE